MTKVLLTRTKNGALVECKAEGHAFYAAKGQDIVCSAVTVLVRTAAQVLLRVQGIRLEGNACERGNISFKVSFFESDEEALRQLKFVGDFLETGLSSVFKEFPDNLEFICNIV